LGAVHCQRIGSTGCRLIHFHFEALGVRIAPEHFSIFVVAVSEPVQAVDQQH
jgi:hypothetical protein